MDCCHSDLCGPTKTTTNGGDKYFLSIIDDYSRKLWIYIPKSKDETFGRFKVWCNEVQLEKVTTLKCLRTDNGLEFLSKEFTDFCKRRASRDT